MLTLRNLLETLFWTNMNGHTDYTFRKKGKTITCGANPAIKIDGHIICS